MQNERSQAPSPRSSKQYCNISFDEDQMAFEQESREYQRVLRPFTALHGYAYDGDERGLQQRLAAGDEIDNFGTDEEGYSSTPLFFASARGHKKCVRILLNKGATANAVCSSTGSSALEVAAQNGELGVVRMLLEAGAVPDRQPKSTEKAGTNSDNGTSTLVYSGGTGPLHVAAAGGFDRIVDALLYAGATVDLPSSHGWTALHLSCADGHNSCVKLLLRSGASISKATDDGLTAIHIAARSGSVAVMKTILSKGGRINETVPKVGTPLATASSFGVWPIVRFLLREGADPNIPHYKRRTPLMETDELVVVKMLLDARASATAMDDEGNGLLHNAALKQRSSGVICALFKAGASPILLNKEGQTPADIASSKNYLDTATLLDMLAAKYREREGITTAQTPPCSSETASEAATELGRDLGGDLKSSVDSKDEKKEVVDGKHKEKVLQPCLNCQNLTHRRCAKCVTTYICSRECQMATLATHKPQCMEIYEERMKAKAERRAARAETQQTA